MRRSKVTDYAALNESNKGKNTQNNNKKHEHAWTRTHDPLVVNSVP